jgi:rhodanese-related sulfurtransferase
MMQRFDVCNGDADGLCATVQWRWFEPAQATLVTGLKREIALLSRVQASAGDEVNVFDLSMQRNQAAMRALLDAGVRLRYVDHHATGDVPHHPLLQAHVDQGRDVCTSLLVDRLIHGACRGWALVGAYGDNLAAVADQLAIAGGVEAWARAGLKRMGEAINYNAYGQDDLDVLLAPHRLYRLMQGYRDPLEMLAAEPIIDALDAQRQADLQQATSLTPMWQGGSGRVLCLPDAAWARRVIGVLANELANAQPDQAHAVLRQQADGSYSVSVRAPLSCPSGADTLCQAFGGNGRARAAGIDALPSDLLPRFVATFAAAPWGTRGL